MNEKIEWYKEVLDLEPGSRIFFPLARLLGAEGQTAEAVAVLRQGLAKHPDHVEARLLLVEMLAKQGDATQAVGHEVDDIGKLLAAYPAFWQSWSDRLSSVPSMNEAAMALRFFSHALEGKNIDWAQVIGKGIMALIAESAADTDVAVSSPSIAGPAVQGSGTSTPEPAKGSGEGASASAQARGRRQVSISLSPVEGMDLRAATPVPATIGANEDELPEEGISLRTRSMAEVLAEQGDHLGAADIYQELVDSAPEDEKAGLEARLEELRLQGGAIPEVAEDKPEDKTAKIVPVESTRLVGLLESLAQRLEDRAR